MSGSRERIARIAARHGLRIEKLFAMWAVLEVPAGKLSAVANDSEVDQLSSNYLVNAQMEVSNQTIGADLVQQGGWAPDIGPLSGAGVGVAVLDSASRRCRNCARIVATRTSRKRWSGLDQTVMAPRRGHHRRGRREPFDERAAWRRARTSST